MTCKEFENLILPLSDRLFALAFGLLGNADDARDAVQETCMKMWQTGDRLRDMERPEAFVRTCLRNECLMVLRRRVAASEEELPADEPPADAATDRQERRSLAARLLRSLAPKARRVVMLRHLGEYSNREVALLTGETEANVRQLLSRARRQMRDLLDEEAEG